MRKNRIAALTLAAVLLLTVLGGCKIIEKGTEAQYTGVASFDAGAEAAGDWGAVAQEITGKAEDLAGVMSAGADANASYSVSFTGKVEELVTKGPKNSLMITVDGVSDKVELQMGSVYSGTSVRDCQTVKAFESFTNQTEWSQYAKTINAQVHTNVVEPLGDLNALVGKTVQVTGCFTGGDKVVVTPVSITVS